MGPILSCSKFQLINLSSHRYGLRRSAIDAPQDLPTKSSDLIKFIVPVNFRNSSATWQYDITFCFIRNMIDSLSLDRRFRATHVVRNILVNPSGTKGKWPSPFRNTAHVWNLHSAMWLRKLRRLKALVLELRKTGHRGSRSLQCVIRI